MILKNQIYTPTLVEKLLGRHYKWWYLMIYGIKSNSAYVITDIFWYSSKVLGILIVIYLYYKLNQPSILQDVLITNLFAVTQGFLASYVISYSINDGSITKHLLYPTDVLAQTFFIRLGVAIRGIVFNFFAFLLSLYLLGVNVNIVYLGFVFMVFFFSSIIIKYLSDFIVGISTFWLTDGYGIIAFYLTVISALSGTLIPIYFLPNFLWYNPFAFVAYHPMQIYLGKYTPTQTGWTLLGGITWCFVLYLLARFVFKAGLKRNEAVGL